MLTGWGVSLSDISVHYAICETYVVVVVFHGSMVNWRSGCGQSVMKIIWCNGLPEIHAKLAGGSISQSGYVCQI